ncbi:MAG: acylphosphatase [Candidatus Riflebacteria bacterium]|nr:acylphosphatase [Candidatus Riflebacteria bacterium]
MEKIRRVHLIIKGEVQDVGYRAFARRNAQKLKLFGWVKNRYDESVETVVEGPRDAVEEMVGLLRTGPSFSHITELEFVEDVEIQEFRHSDFQVRE